MSFNGNTAADKAREDLSNRLDVKEADVSIDSITDSDFPDMSLGAPVGDEMSASMISSGWTIILTANSHKYEYRADKYQLRLVGYKNANYLVAS